MNNFKLYSLWSCKVILSVLFLLASSSKLTNHEAVIEMFSNWGFFQGFHWIIGLLELCLAILLLVPKTSLYSAISLFVIMIGALTTHIIHDPIGQIVRPIVFMILLSIVISLQGIKGLP